MEGTREDKLAKLHAQNSELESLEVIDNALGKELGELENEVPVQ